MGLRCRRFDGMMTAVVQQRCDKTRGIQKWNTVGFSCDRGIPAIQRARTAVTTTTWCSLRDEVVFKPLSMGGYDARCTGQQILSDCSFNDSLTLCFLLLAAEHFQ